MGTPWGFKKAGTRRCFKLEWKYFINYLREIEILFQRYLNLGALELSMNRLKYTAANLKISFKDGLDKTFFISATQQLEKVLKNTTASITLHIDELHEKHVMHLNKLLKRLSQHGDRINIVVHEKLRQLIDIDS